MPAPAKRREEAARLTPSVGPGGVLRLEAGAGDADGLTAASRERLLAAAERGEGHLLLGLGAAEADRLLAPGLRFFRDLGRSFVTRLVGTPDLETLRERVEVPAPEAELARFAVAVPPIRGAELVDAECLARWWAALGEAFREEIRASEGTVQERLAREGGAAWHLVGRVTFHLAENRGDETHPFAFLATYTTGRSTSGRAGARQNVKHRALALALEESAAARDRGLLLSLLVPVKRAAEKSPLLAELLESGELYEAMAWTPAQARRFLDELPALEAAGVVVRVPDWWRARRPPRPEVQVLMGTHPPQGGRLGVDSLLDFRVQVAIDGELLGPAELAALLASADGLALVKGRWVELDAGKLRAVLDHWKKVEREAKDGVSFLEGMRLLAGAPGADVPAEPATGFSRTIPGEWLAKTLAELRRPDAATDPGPALRGTLRPYQRVGVGWLRLATSLGLGVCLADDMGLGKTLQVLALLLLERQRGVRPHLLVLPASLVANWQAEIVRFAPSLRVHVAHPSAASEPFTAETDLVITTYGQLSRQAWLREQTFALAVLDEAQAIKNPGTQQARAAKAVRARARVALTGTPVENRLGDLWSLFDFLQPGLLGSAREFTTIVKRLGERPEEPYAPLRRLVAPYLLRRLKTDRSVAPDLPEKTELRAFCALARPQAALYQRAVDGLAAELRLARGQQRRGIVLTTLVRLKQICNHPAHYLGEGEWSEGESGKLLRVRELCEEIAARQEKVLVFTQFREATEPVASFLEEVFGRPGVILHGSVPVKQRAERVKRFQEDPDTPFFVLSLKAGGTGLNLTAATHVIHFDRWWNPAVEDQATDRAFRIGQRRNVLVHKLVCRGTVEERIDEMIAGKKGLAAGVLERGGEEALTEMSDAELLAFVALDLRRAAADA